MSLSPLGLPKVSPTGLQGQILRGYLPDAGPLGWETQARGQTFERTSATVILLCVGHPARGGSLDLIAALPPTCLTVPSEFLLYFFSCRGSFLVGFGLSSSSA